MEKHDKAAGLPQSDSELAKYFKANLPMVENSFGRPLLFHFPQPTKEGIEFQGSQYISKSKVEELIKELEKEIEIYENAVKKDLSLLDYYSAGALVTSNHISKLKALIS